MPGHRPRSTPRPPARWPLLSLILLIALVPAVSAEVIIDEEMHEFEDTGGSISVSKSSHSGANSYVNKIYLKNIQDVTDLHYIIFTIDGNDGAALSTFPFTHKGESGSWPVSFTLGGQAFDATLYKTYQRNYLGTITATRYAIYFDEWDIGTLTGTQYLQFTDPFFWTTADSYIPMPTNDLIWLDGTSNKKFVDYAYTITISCVKDWKNRLIVTSMPGGYDVSLQRQYDAMNYASRLTALKNDASVYYQERATDFRSAFATSEIDTIKISSASTDYLWPLASGGTEDPDPDTATVTVYVRSSQTNALIADARVVIEAGFNDPAELLVVSNTTLPSGTKTYTLQPTGGGLPNPDFYRVTVTADGYNAEMPYADIELEAGVSMTMIMGMEPTSGGPIDPEKTYIEFYVRDINANPIPNAVVKCGAYTLMTNSAGFTQFDLPKNATYQYTVRKTGYTPIEGSVTVGANSRYPVNVVLGAGTVPTLTPGPTEPGATPTPDRRTNEEKGQSIIDMIADNAEGIAALAIIGTLLGLLKLIAKW